MKIEEIRNRLEKAQAEVQKKLGTIEKKTTRRDKLAKGFTDKYGVNPLETEGKSSILEAAGIKERSEEWNDAYWTLCDIDSLDDDIKNLYKKIEEKEATIKKYEDALYKAEEIDSIYEKEIPESMKAMEAELIIEWDRYDKEKREYYKMQYKELGFEKFIKKYTYAAYQSKNKTDDEIHQTNVKNARAEVLDLYNRVKEITGEITDWSHIRLSNGNSFPVLNGWVKGKEGSANVESILAGGYNIQRLHIRTLVHRI